MFKYLKAVCLLVPRFIVEYFAWILPYSINPRKIPIEKRFAKVQNICKKILKAFNVICYDEEFINFYKTKDKNKNYLIFSNHLSFLDPLLFLSVAQSPVTFVAKKETRKYPLVGRIIRIMEGEFLDREDLKQELRVFKSVQERIVSDDKLDILIFPEGTRNKEPLTKGVGEFHPGTFRCAFKTQANIMVCPIFGTFRAVNTKYKEKYNPIIIKMSKELKYDDYKDKNTVQLAEELHNLMDEEVKEFKEIDQSKLKFLNK